MSGQVLVLDASFRPIRMASKHEAATYLAKKKAIGVAGVTVIATYHTATDVFEVPKVIMLQSYVPIPRKLSQVVTNNLLFARDDWTCQYCGRHKRDLRRPGTNGKRDRGEYLTRDHVKPRCLFEDPEEANTWENCTTACSTCNSKKGHKLPYECGMMPRKTPKRPFGVLMTLYDKVDHEQAKFVEPWLAKIA